MQCPQDSKGTRVKEKKNQEEPALQSGNQNSVVENNQPVADAWRKSVQNKLKVLWGK